MERPEFEKLVAAGIDAIPRQFLDKLSNVVITVEDWPNADQTKKARLGPHSLLFGLYEGVPQTKRTNYSMVLPDKITIFQKSIEAVAQDSEHIKAIVKDTVWYEIAHHFGLDESEVRRREQKRT